MLLRRPDDIVIAVMGVTGSGKSTFISHFSDDMPVIGRNLVSCKQGTLKTVLAVLTSKGTGEVGIFRCSAKGIGTFYLVDTPGFDDTHKSDTDILLELTAWLNQAYEDKILLTGIIYLHRIMDPRLGGKALQNLKMFKSLCGDEALSKVVLATTFWGNVNPITGVSHEKDLEKSEFWGTMIRKGSKVLRQDKGQVSARSIIEYLVRRRTPASAGVALDIQKQMVDEGKSLDQTGAGQEMNAQILAMRKEYEEKIATLRADLRVAIERKDEEWKAQIEDERRKTRTKLEKEEKDRQKLQADNEELKKRLNDTRGSFDRDFLDTERRMQGLEYELQIMRERNEAAEKQQELRNQVQAKQNKLEMLQWKIRQAQTCVLM